MPITAAPSRNSHHDDPAYLLWWLAKKLRLSINADTGVMVDFSQPLDEIFRRAVTFTKPSFRIEARRSVYDSASEVDVTDIDFACTVGLICFLEREEALCPGQT